MKASAAKLLSTTSVLLTRHPTTRAFHSTPSRRYGYPHKTPALYLNRILFDASEIDDCSNNNDKSEWMATVTLPKSDYRTVHIAKILGLQNGDVVRAGSVISDTNDSSIDDNQHNQLQGLLTDQATIQWLPEGKIKKASPTKNGDPPGSLRLYIPHPPQTVFQNQTSNEAPPVSLLLALPRPLQLQRILPMISQLGVDTLILTHAAKVPKDYFGSHLFRKPQLIRDLLIEGLTLSGMDLKLPKVVVSKRPVGELLEEMEDWFGGEEWVRVIAHPERRNLDGSRCGDDDVVRMTDLVFSMEEDGKRRRLLVAVG
jgi:hypothetical protein